MAKNNPEFHGQSTSGVASHPDPEDNTRPGFPKPMSRPFPKYTEGDSSPNQCRDESAPNMNEGTMDFSKKFS